MFANVPRAITASFPLREPYELNSRGVNLNKNHQRSYIKAFTEHITWYSVFYHITNQMVIIAQIH